MGDILQNAFGGQTDNPFQVPAPTMQEILFRTLAGSLPPAGQLKVPGTVGGRILGTGARVIGSLADVMGSELTRQRIDPNSRQIQIQQQSARLLDPFFKKQEPIQSEQFLTPPPLPVADIDYLDQERGPLFVPPTVPQRVQPSVPSKVPSPPSPIASKTLTPSAEQVAAATRLNFPLEVLGIKTSQQKLAEAREQELKSREQTRASIAESLRPTLQQEARQRGFNPNVADLAIAEIIEGKFDFTNRLLGAAQGQVTPTVNGLALGRFGKPFLQLSPEQQGLVQETGFIFDNLPPGAKAVLLEKKNYNPTDTDITAANAEAERRDVRKAGQKIQFSITEKQRAAEDAPLNEKSVFWLDPKTGMPASPEESRRDAKASGLVPITQKGLEATAMAGSALVQIGEYRSLVTELLPKRTGNVAADLTNVQANRLRLKVLRASGDPAAQRLEALQGAIATLARATGDTANVAVAERELLKKFVLTDNDTQESAIQKLAQAERILKSVGAGRNAPIRQVPQLPATSPSGAPKILSIERAD